MLIKDVVATTYVLLNNCGEDELDYVVVLEQLASLINYMKQERILGNVEEVITKGTLTFSDSTGIVENTLTNFGDVVYLEFNSQPIDECPVSQLDIYANSGVQRAAFWSNTTVLGTKYAQMALAQSGTLKVWYEPEDTTLLTKDATVDLKESLKYCLATRLAANCIQYVRFKDPVKMAGIPVLALMIRQQAEDWRKVYLEKVNKIGTNRPFARIPFMSGTVGN